MKHSRRPRFQIKVTADTISLVGLALIINEAVFREGAERPVLIGLFALMIGISPISRADEIRNNLMKREENE